MAKPITLFDIKRSVLSTPAFKLRDGQDNNHQIINLRAQFGFVPEMILIEKIRGRNNALVVSAIPRKLVEQILAQEGGRNGSKNKSESDTDAKSDSKDTGKNS